MKNLSKQIFTIFLSVILIQGSAFSAVTGTPQSNNVSDSIECSFNSETDYFPLGDTKGNSLLTHKETLRDCTISRTELGECTLWEESEETSSLSPGEYNAYESNNYSDSIGSLFAALGAYDQIEHLWSGWKGYCETGTKSDFTWAEDPMFWGSMAMSMVMSSTQVDAADPSNSGFLADTSLGDTVNGMSSTVGEATGELFTAAGTDIVTEGATAAGEAAGSAAVAATESAATDMTFEFVDQAVEAGMNQFYNNLGRCMIAGGFDMAATLYEFSQSDGGGMDCDPVDEICQENGEGDGEESKVMTMDEVQFNDLVDQFSGQDPDSVDLYDYVYVIPPSPEEGIVSFRMKRKSEMAGIADMDTSAMDDIEDKMKQMEMQISLGIAALSLGGCLAFGGDGAVGQQGDTGTDEDRANLRAGVSAAIGFASKYMGPYGALIGAAMKIILYVATSYKSIDTCNDEDDAKEAGLRAERTQKALEFDLCHQVKVECAEYSYLAGSFGSNDCVLDGYTYCCYDQIMAKILVEQLKAQLGRDWAHCTGITLRDLNYVSFKQCRNNQMDSSDGLGLIDGAHVMCGMDQGSDCYDPENAWQYYYHCIDMTEFLEYLKATTGMEIDMDDFESFWNDMTESSTHGATY